MTPVTETVKEWKRICREFQSESDDILIPALLEVFETIDVILKRSDQSRIQFYLKSLDSERSMCLSAENAGEISIRTMVYGVIQSVHGVLVELTSPVDSISSESESALVIVKEWKGKFDEFSEESDDTLIPVIAKVFVAIELILKGSDKSRIQLALKSLESKRSMCQAAETTGEPSIRTLTYGLIECVHGCLLNMTMSKNSEEILHDEITDPDLLDALMQMKKEEPMDDDGSVKEIEQLSENGFSTTPNFTAQPIVQKKVPIELKKEEPIDPENDQMFDDFDFNLDEETNRMTRSGEEVNDIAQAEIGASEVSMANDKSEKKDEKEEEPIAKKKEEEAIAKKKEEEEAIDKKKEEEEAIDKKTEEEPIDKKKKKEGPIAKSPNKTKDSSEDEARRKLPRKVSKRPSYVKSVLDSDEEDELPVKKSKSDSKKNNGLDVNGSGTSRKRVTKVNHVELECPQCEFRSKSVPAWTAHLKIHHSTTPTQSGLILRCECGHESFSDCHSKVCDISKITIVRKGDGTTKEPQVSRVNHTELECPECEFRTKSVIGWRLHLARIHSTSPVKSRLMLRCECGHESFSDNHSRVCTISKITILHKGDGKTKDSS